MISPHKVYEGTVYVSHSVSEVPLRHSPTKQWRVDVVTSSPPGMTDLPFSAVFSLDKMLPPRSHENAVDAFLAGLVSKWKTRTSTDTDWIAKVKKDLMEALSTV